MRTAACVQNCCCRRARLLPGTPSSGARLKRGESHVTNRVESDLWLLLRSVPRCASLLRRRRSTAPTNSTLVARCLSATPKRLKSTRRVFLNNLSGVNIDSEAVRGKKEVQLCRVEPPMLSRFILMCHRILLIYELHQRERLGSRVRTLLYILESCLRTS